MKVMPAPEEVQTLAIPGLDDAAAVLVMNKALAGAQDVSAAAHLPRAAAEACSPGGDAPLTLIRLEGTRASVAHRLMRLQEEIETAGAVLEDIESSALWRAIRDESRIMVALQLR